MGTQDWESGAMAWDGGQPGDGFGRQWGVQRGGRGLGEPSQSIEGGLLNCLPLP